MGNLSFISYASSTYTITNFPLSLLQITRTDVKQGNGYLTEPNSKSSWASSASEGSKLGSQGWHCQHTQPRCLGSTQNRRAHQERSKQLLSPTCEVTPAQKNFEFPGMPVSLVHGTVLTRGP